MSSLQNFYNVLMQIFSSIKFNYEWIKNTSADRICWVFQKWSFQGGQTFQIPHLHCTKQPVMVFQSMEIPFENQHCPPAAAHHWPT